MRKRLVDLHNLTGGTYYTDVFDTKECVGTVLLQSKCSGTVTVTIESCIEYAAKDNNLAADTWVDITSMCLTVPALGSAVSYTDPDNILWIPPVGRIRVKYVTADATNDIRFTLETHTNPMVFPRSSVVVASSALPSGAATETTLSSADGHVHSIDGKTPALGSAAMAASSPVTIATDDTLLSARLGGIRRTTTPSKADAATERFEVDKVGNEFVNACARHQRIIPLTSGLAASAASLGEGPCAAIMVNTDDCVVYAQPIERALIASQSGADWTGGTDWTRAGNIWSHANGGAGDLEITTTGDNAIVVGETYLVIYTLVWTSGTSLTEKLGTGAGAARSSSATFVRLVTSAGSAKIIFSATADAVCSIDVSAVYVLPATPPLKKGVPYPLGAIKICGIATEAAPATALTTGKVWGVWYRRPGATELT